jgi:phage terminase large subunit
VNTATLTREQRLALLPLLEERARRHAVIHAERTLCRSIPKAIPVLENDCRYRFLHGGRGSGKSHFFAEMVILRMLQNPDFSVVCAREVQKSLALSAKKLIESKIREYKLTHLFEIQQTLIKRIGGTGLCVFSGLLDHTVESIKSLDGFDACWIEEAASVSERSLSLVRPTIRKQGSEIWASWNRRKRSDPIDRLATSGRDDVVCVHINYLDNPMLPDTLLKEAEDAREIEPDTYPHVWLGAYEDAGSRTVIPPIWVESAVGLAEDLGLEVTGKRYAALDVAGAEEGGDENGWAGRCGIELHALEKWNGLDTAATTQQAIRLCRLHQVNEMQYDSVSVGEGVTGEWAAMGRRSERPAGLMLIAWNGGDSVLEPDVRIDPDSPTSPKNKDHYHNLKAQGWYALRKRFQQSYAARTGKPYDPDMVISISRRIPDVMRAKLADELSQPQHKPSGTGKVLVDKQPEKGDKSPNLADAVMMCFHPIPARTSGPNYDAW